MVREVYLHVLTKTVYLEKGAIVDPKAIVRGHDNGLIIVGSIDHKAQPKNAWATKTDNEGKVLWRYSLPPREPLPNFEGPEYSSAAMMPDNSVFLCGGMPLSKEGHGLLTHMDKDGKVLSEKLISPEGMNGGGAYACTAWKDGVLFLGVTGTWEKVEATATHPAIYTHHSFYWIAYFDANGEKKWEKLIPSIKVGFNYISPLQITADGGVAFVATRYGIGSQVVRMDNDGKIKESKIFNEQFVLLQPTYSDTHLWLISTTTNKMSIVKLNDKLEEISHLTETQVPGVIHTAYRLADGSLMLFGSQYHFGTIYYAVAMRVDPNLKHMQTLDLSVRGESYWINDAVPLGKPGEFATIRRAIKTKDIGINPTDAQLDDVRRGIALDFINF